MFGGGFLRTKANEKTIFNSKVKAKRKSVKIKICCEICGWDGHGNQNLVIVHHVVPTAVGGKNEESNIILLCPNHHAIAHMIFHRKNGEYNGPQTPKLLKEKLTKYENDWQETDLKIKIETIALLDKIRKKKAN